MANSSSARSSLREWLHKFGIHYGRIMYYHWMPKRFGNMIACKTYYIQFER